MQPWYKNKILLSKSFKKSYWAHMVVCVYMLHYQKGFPNTPAIGWSIREPRPNSHHWLSHCCCAWKLKQTEVILWKCNRNKVLTFFTVSNLQMAYMQLSLTSRDSRMYFTHFIFKSTRNKTLSFSWISISSTVTVTLTQTTHWLTYGLQFCEYHTGRPQPEDIHRES